MKKITPIFLAVLMMMFSSLACGIFGVATPAQASVENLRMAYDQHGIQDTTTFSSADVIYAVAELNNAPQGAVVKAVWTAVDATDTDANYEFQEQTLDITDELFSGTIYFQLSNDNDWPPGLYRVDVFLDDEPAQSLEFNIE